MAENWSVTKFSVDVLFTSVCDVVSMHMYSLCSVCTTVIVEQ